MVGELELHRRLATFMSSVRRATHRPAFWITSSIVFSSNAILSLLNGQWLLATFQTVTAVIALAAAAQTRD